MRGSKAKAIRRDIREAVKDGRWQEAEEKHGMRAVGRVALMEQRRGYKRRTRDAVRQQAQEVTLPESPLTPNQERVWVLHQKGFSNKEIAAKLDMPESSVRGRLSEAKKKMANAG